MARSDGFHHRRERQGLIVSNIEEVKPPPLDASEAEKKELKNKILSTNRNLKKQSTTHKQTIFFMEVSKNERS
jgi:hypothetical protein